MEYDQYDFPRELWYTLPTWEIATKIATFVPVIGLGVLGNYLMLAIIARNRSLQTPTNWLLANMAAADLLTLTICPVLFMFNNFYQDFRLGEVGCLAEGFLEGALLVTGVLNLCAVSYDRLTAIVLPTETRITVRGAKYLMVITWLVGAAFATPLALFRFYRERRWRNYLESFCSENPNILPTYWHVLIGAIVWLPLTVMVCCYAAILWKLDRYEAQVVRREHPICVSYKRRVAKTLFAVVLTFVVLRVPFTVMVFARHNMLQSSMAGINQVDGSFSVLWYTSHYLIFLHAAVNPLIYGLTNDNFRRAYTQTPWCCWRRAAAQLPAAAAAARLPPRVLPKVPEVVAVVKGRDNEAGKGGGQEGIGERLTSQPKAERRMAGGGWGWLNRAGRLGGYWAQSSSLSASKATMVTSVKTVSEPGDEEPRGTYRPRSDEGL